MRRDPPGKDSTPPEAGRSGVGCVLVSRSRTLGLCRPCHALSRECVDTDPPGTAEATPQCCSAYRLARVLSKCIGRKGARVILPLPRPSPEVRADRLPAGARVQFALGTFRKQSLGMAEERAQRRLTTILAADVVGYSRLMEQDEAGTMSRLRARRHDVLMPLVAQGGGRVFKFMGDGVLIEAHPPIITSSCASASTWAMSSSRAAISTAMASTWPHGSSRSPTPAESASPAMSTAMSAASCNWISRTSVNRRSRT